MGTTELKRVKSKHSFILKTGKAELHRFYMPTNKKVPPIKGGTFCN